MRAYHYFYYRGYDLLKLTGNYDLAWGASHFMAFSLMMAVFNILHYFREWVDIITLGIFGLITFVLIHVLNFFIFLRESRFEAILKEFDKESRISKKTGRIITFLTFIILACGLFRS